MLHAKFHANHSNCLGGVQKSMFFIVCNFVDGKLLQKWAWHTPHNSAEFKEHVAIRFNNVPHYVGVYGPKTLSRGK